MVFERFGFGREEKIEFSEIESWVSERIEMEREKISKSSLSIAREIEKEFSALHENVLRIKEFEREELFKKLATIVKNSQKIFSESMARICERVKLEGEDFSSLFTFYKEVVEALEQMKKMDMMHGRYLYLVFENEMSNLRRILKNLVFLNEKFEKNLRSKGEKLESLEKALEMVKNFEKIEGELMELRVERENLEKKVEEMDIDFEGRIKKLKNSKEYKSYLENLEKIEDLKKRIKEIEDEVYNKLHSLSRILKKFKKAVDTQKISFDKAILRKYENLDSQVFFSENFGYPDLKKLLNGFKDAIEREILKEKKQKLEKVKTIISEFLEDKYLQHQKTYLELKNELKNLEKREFKAIEEISKLEGEKEKRKNRVKRIEKRISKVWERIENLEKELPTLRKEIEKHMFEKFKVRVI